MFSLVFSGLLLSACTVSVDPPERLNVQLSTCLSEVPGWEAFTRCEAATKQPLEGCFVWGGEETRGWNTLVYDGSWKLSGGTALAGSEIELLSTASLFVSFQRLPCETLLPNTRCVDVENCLFSMHNGQRSSTNPNAVVFDEPMGCNIDGELSLDDYQCSKCGDGVHQINEECDPTANNFHARICHNNCTIDRMGSGSSGVGGSGIDLPLNVHVTLNPVGVESDEGPTRLDFDLWVFHPSHVDEEPVTNFDFAFSQSAPSAPPWMEGSVLDEDDPYNLELTLNVPSRSCTDGYDLRLIPGELMLIGLTARSLPINADAEPLPVEAVITVEDSSGQSFLGHVIQFPDDSDLFVFSAFNVCWDGTRNLYRFMRYPNVKTRFNSEP